MKKQLKTNSKVSAILNKKNDFKTYELILFALLLVVASSFLTAVIVNKVDNYNSNKVNSDGKISSGLQEFEEVYELINDSYYKDIDKNKLINGAINGMLSSLNDPHTSYYDETETKSFNELMDGTYKGIGAELSINSDGEVFIVSIFKNSPAQEVGLKFNDVILEVNGTSTKNLTTTEVVKLIKDERSETVKIKIKRDSSEQEYTLTKRYIEIESVESRIVIKNDQKIGYIIINTFANNTYEQFKKQIEELETNNIKGLVIDVRGNSGGFLHSVTNMINMFLPRGKVIYQISDKKKTYKYTDTTEESRNYPVAVLVDKASASASEILAISLRESYGAYVVGTSTYGKGTVQITKNLKTGGMIKYTVQKWLSPEGNWINEIGVEPTHNVELSEKFFQNQNDDNDNQLQKALDLISKK